MPTVFIRSTQLARAQFAEYERVAWFLLETFERERRLNLEALSATPPVTAIALLGAMHPFFLFPWSLLAVAAPKR
ncbi:hypothetical protein C7T35_27625 [Variovorax sp. WS11]|uniref:hypothetical protein n=1 Tax=Variovorax sp. WS11 TaxID=1105204 RepID=UPI000D0E28FA|nr:hypothetical protein [Variovorax sp. WS11]NDZ16917.1 hypothetical protein [Variovorax sp. WS11]PSL81315.1 hypothetical protein C7T35_27625 [Variovorax sp. WS11]